MLSQIHCLHCRHSKWSKLRMPLDLLLDAILLAGIQLKSGKHISGLWPFLSVPVLHLLNSGFQGFDAFLAGRRHQHSISAKRGTIRRKAEAKKDLLSATPMFTCPGTGRSKRIHHLRRPKEFLWYRWCPKWPWTHDGFQVLLAAMAVESGTQWAVDLVFQLHILLTKMSVEVCQMDMTHDSCFSLNSLFSFNPCPDFFHG